jgi:hypothetical protein
MSQAAAIDQKDKLDILWCLIQITFQMKPINLNKRFWFLSIIFKSIYKRSLHDLFIDKKTGKENSLEKRLKMVPNP